MVKVSLKGGVWKNSEDEILKAAVQKYGKQQWARVASLLNRKTAKQAKARWHEWLDPSIKKTEWSRQEEEKLLHLAKLMPAQWKTIGPLVGRTATQCQEHYERLLDQAASASGSAGAGDGGDATTDALRQQTALRPGQIDAHPETRPARPDPIDMDEDEMEMLQEARARLANTVGKKAKRKQREKMLAQAKRLADLQKRRELKQAGLLSAAARKKASKRNRDIDLGVEIPFHKPAPAGFHATESEDSRAESIRKKRLKQVDYHKVNEAQYRTRDREAAEAQKREQARLRVLEQSTEKYAQQEKALLEDEKMPARPRVGLSLPAPSIQDEEWQAWHKENQQKKQPPGLAAGGGGGVTAALMGDYTDRPLPTPMRTPGSAGASGSSVNLTERATALRQLERGQTPLLTSASAMDEDVPEQEDEPDSKPSARPSSRSVANRTPSRRDALGLNTGAGHHHDDGASVGASTFASSRYVSDDDELRRQAREERRALKAARQQLEAALAALPAPQFDYELAAPDVETVDDDDDMDGSNKLKRPKDQAEVEAAERQAKRLKLEEELEARSTVLKRPDLPRPARIVPETVVVESQTYPEAALLVQKEMLRLLQHDAYAHPVVTNKKKKQEATVAAPPVPAVTLEPMDVTALRNARQLLESEASVEMLEKASAADNHTDAPLQANIDASSAGAADWVCLKGSWQKAASDKDRLASLQSQYAILNEATAALRKRNDKTEHKLSVVNGGYAKRSVALKDEILQTEAARQHACIEQAVFGRLQQQEAIGAVARVEKLQSEVNALKALEASLQKQYGDLRIERRRKTLSNK